MMHLLSIVVLLLKITATNSCRGQLMASMCDWTRCAGVIDDAYLDPAGISLKTQEMYALVFATRYLDLFTNFVSLYVLSPVRFAVMQPPRSC
jgi:ER lumen protein retaining receptor